MQFTQRQWSSVVTVWLVFCLAIFVIVMGVFVRSLGATTTQSAAEELGITTTTTTVPSKAKAPAEYPPEDPRSRLASVEEVQLYNNCRAGVVTGAGCTIVGVRQPAPTAVAALPPVVVTTESPRSNPSTTGSTTTEGQVTTTDQQQTTTEETPPEVTTTVETPPEVTTTEETPVETTVETTEETPVETTVEENTGELETEEQLPIEEFTSPVPTS